MYKVAELKSKDDDEHNAWKELQAHNIIPINKFIHNIDVDMCDPSRYSVVTDTEVPIYLCENSTKCGNLGNFKNATCSKFRPDGQMAIIGTQTGEILLVAMISKGNILRKMKLHDGAINKLEYLHNKNPEKQLIASIGNDGTLQIYNINDQNLVHKFSDSKEPLKALAVHRIDHDIIATGSMDCRIRVYNLANATNQLSAVIETQMPVNCLQFPWDTMSTLLLSAGQSTIQLWDMNNLSRLGNGTDCHAPIQSKTPHHMQITDMSISDGLYGNERVVFTVGLDGLVKVVSLADFREIYKFEYPSGLVGVRVLPQSRYLVVAGNDPSDGSKGYIYTRRIRADGEVKEESKLKRCLTTEHLKIMKLADRFNEPNKTISIIEHGTRDKLNRIDKLLKSHKHRVAMSFALNTQNVTKGPEHWQKLIRELDCLGALKKSVAERGNDELTKMLKVITNFIWIPRFTGTFMRLLNVILAAYPYKQIVENRQFLNLKSVMTVASNRFKKLDQTMVGINNLLVSCESHSPDSFAKIDYPFASSIGEF